jgi:hypothetical protein
MLVYSQEGPPATLVAHGQDGRTWLALVDSPEQRPAPELSLAISRAILAGPATEES